MSRPGGRSAFHEPDPALLLAALFVLGLAFRILHLQAVSGIVLTGEAEIGMDRWLQMHIAQDVARGNWLGGWTAAYDTGPAYGYWLGLLYRLSGERWVGPLLVQATLGAATPVVLYALAARLANRRVAVLAAVLAALYTPAIFYELLQVKSALLPFVAASYLYALLRARESFATRWIFLAGVAAGVLTSLRANVGAAAAVMACWLVWPLPRWRLRFRVLLLLAAGGTMILLPVLVRDQLAAQRERGSSLWGIHVYIGTNARADGSYVPIPGIRDDVVGHVVDARRVAERQVGRPLTPNEVSLYWFGRAVDFVRAEPLRYLALEWRKLALALQGGEEGSFGESFDDFREASWVLRLPLPGFGAVCPLAFLGAIVTVARRRNAILILFVGAYLASMLAFFVAGRYRLPLVPPMLVLASEALCWIEDTASAEHSRTLLAAALLVGTLVVVVPHEARDPWLFLGTLVTGVALAWWLDGRSGAAIARRSAT